MSHPQIQQRHEVASNRFFTFVQEDLRLEDGDDYTYYHLESHFDAVIVVPLFADGHILVEHIYRHPYRRQLMEFPAGGIDPGEDPCAAGLRELREETGYQARTVQHLHSYEAIPGLLRMRLHVVLAQDLQGGAPLQRDAMEIMEVERISQAAAWQVADGPDASSFLTMGLLALSRYSAGQLPKASQP